MTAVEQPAVITPTVGDAPFTRTLELEGTGWSVWRSANVRSAGFAADGLSVFGGHRSAAGIFGPAGQLTEADFIADRDEEEQRLAALVERADFVTALVWQSRSAWRMIVSPGGGSSSRRRQRLRSLALYWQRYCSKAETIGFFGPSAWVAFDDRPDGDFEHGVELVRQRRTFLEAWAAASIGAAWSRDDRIRRWFCPYRRPDVAIDAVGSQARAGSRRIRLSDADLAVARHCDGHTTVTEIADVLGVAVATVESAVVKLVRKRVLLWDARIPTTADAHRILEERAMAVADPVAAARCLRDLAAVEVGIQAVARAQSPESLDGALTALSREFEAITGEKSSRAEAKSYAARSICFEDAARDIDMTIGTAALAPHARALGLVADASRWFTDRLAHHVEAEIDAIIDDVSKGELSSITLADIWHRAMTVFWGQAPAVERARRELAERWARTIEAQPHEIAAGCVRRRVVELLDQSPFADLTGTMETLPHSPDLQFVADDPAALLAGNSVAILSEMHAALVSLDVPPFTWTLGGPDEFRDTLNAVARTRRLVPLLPSTWERNTGRFVPTTCGSQETQIGFANAAAREPRSVVAASDMRLVRADGRTHVVLPDGSRFTLSEAFAVPLSIVAADGFKVGLPGDRAPRLELDSMVVFRRTWRSPGSDIALRTNPSGWLDFQAVQRWQRSLGIPARVFVKVPGETKPFYLDLTSPVLVAAFAHQVRRHGDRPEPVVVTECLPDPQTSWLVDSAGRRYVSELRVQMLPASSTESRDLR